MRLRAHNRTLVTIILMVIAMSGCHSLPGAGKYDVILSATPIKVKMLKPGVAIDAIEGNPSQAGTAKTVVTFKVEKVLRGRIPAIERGGMSKGEQAVQAVKDKDVLKILTFDFQDPKAMVEKGWFSVAVESPLATFNITDWDNPPPQRKKLYLDEVKQAPGSYILMKVEHLD